jgi:hypothetical protein
MKKWTEKEIATIGYMEMGGPQLEVFLQDLMKNQSEIIDWIESNQYINDIPDQVYGWLVPGIKKIVREEMANTKNE